MFGHHKENHENRNEERREEPREKREEVRAVREAHDSVDHFSGEIEASIRMIAEYVKKQTTDMKVSAVSHDEMKDEIARLRGEMNSQLQRLQEHGRNVRDEDMERRVDKMHSQVSDLMHMKSRHDDLEKQVSELHGTLGRKAMEGMGEDRSVVDAHVQRIRELERKVENMSKILAKGGQGIALRKIKEDLDDELRKFRDDMESKSHAGHAKHEKNSDIESLRSEMDMLRSEIRSGKHHQAVAHSKIEPEGIDDLTNELENMKRMVDEEASLRLSIDKKMRDLYHDFKALESKVDGAPQLESKHSKDDDNVNRKVRDEISRTVTKQLDDFARMMDKKLPQLVTRDELAKLEDKLKSAPRAAVQEKVVHDVETVHDNVDAQQIDRKIALLERRMNELVSALKGYTGTFIIE